MRSLISVITLCLLAGCKTAEPPPPVEAEKVSGRGQVIWKRHAEAEELVLDLHVEAAKDGSVTMQVIKGPIMILAGETSKKGWWVEMPMEDRKHAGKGLPPPQLTWLHLARCFGGSSPLPGWVWKLWPDGSWSFAHRGTGESFEGFLE